MLVDGFKGQKVQDVKKTIQKTMIDNVCDYVIGHPLKAVLEKTFFFLLFIAFVHSTELKVGLKATALRSRQELRSRVSLN